MQFQHNFLAISVNRKDKIPVDNKLYRSRAREVPTSISLPVKKEWRVGISATLVAYKDSIIDSLPAKCAPSHTSDPLAPPVSAASEALDFFKRRAHRKYRKYRLQKKLLQKPSDAGKALPE